METKFSIITSLECESLTSACMINSAWLQNRLSKRWFIIEKWNVEGQVTPTSVSCSGIEARVGEGGGGGGRVVRGIVTHWNLAHTSTWGVMRHSMAERSHWWSDGRPSLGHVNLKNSIVFLSLCLSIPHAFFFSVDVNFKHHHIIFITPMFGDLSFAGYTIYHNVSTQEFLVYIFSICPFPWRLVHKHDVGRKSHDPPTSRSRHVSRH